ncbi:MAG: class II aldolase/adducin family protein [Clostridia bacterium]|nr:class II aldolase/adducin family protein [Clostridia bacterium]
MIKLKSQLIEAGCRIVKSDLVTGTWGNISLRVSGQNRVVITPSGMDYLSLQIEDLVVVNLDGQVLEGHRKPSSELPLHLAIYRARADVGAVVHTHSIYATACAVARIPVPAIVEDMVQLIGGSIDVAPYALPGTPQLAQGAVQALGGKNAVLLANHGGVAVGKDLAEALNVAFMLEKSARIFVHARSLGHPVVLEERDVEIMREGYRNSYGQK